jgi:hypothetical protein
MGASLGVIHNVDECDILNTHNMGRYRQIVHSFLYVNITNTNLTPKKDLVTWLMDNMSNIDKRNIIINTIIDPHITLKDKYVLCYDMPLRFRIKYYSRHSNQIHKLRFSINDVKYHCKTIK